MSEEKDDVVVLTDEEGNDVAFEVVDVFEVDETEYAILLPVDAEETEEGGALIFRIDEDEDGNEIFTEIEDDDEWERVAAVWEELLLEETDEDEDE
ncbi:MAG: DUF1292 domain-containing protein [Firmicutes bacterium]|nr:DUF1292 domain-containing protein [Bacillota bacterium]